MLLSFAVDNVCSRHQSVTVNILRLDVKEDVKPSLDYFVRDNLYQSGRFNLLLNRGCDMGIGPLPFCTAFEGNWRVHNLS